MSKEKSIKRNCTSQKGITLIALAVTIIVLAILAGVTINMVLGDEGIITQANQERENQQRESDIESITMAVSGEDFRTAMSGETRNTDKIKVELEKTYAAGSVSVEKVDDTEGIDLKVTITEDGRQRIYQVDTAGRVTLWGTAIVTANPTTTATQIPTTTPTTTPTPTVKTTATITYRVGVKTFYTEEVALGTTASELAYYTEPEAYLESLAAANDMSDLVNSSGTTDYCGVMYGDTLGFDSDGNKTTVGLSSSDIINEDEEIYIEPSYQYRLTESPFTTSDIIGFQKESSYTELGLTITEIYAWGTAGGGQETGLEKVSAFEIGVYDNAHFSSGLDDSVRGIGRPAWRISDGAPSRECRIWVVYENEQGNQVWASYHSILDT